MTENKSKKKNSSIGLAVIASILAAGAVNSYFDSKSHGKPSDSKINSALMQSADEINRNLPMMVDSITKLNSTIALSGRVFMYSYTLIGINKDEFEGDAFIQAMRPNLINNYKTLEELKTFRDYNVEMRYSYADEQGNSLAKISISPDDF